MASITSTIDGYFPTSATPFGSLTTAFTPPSYCSSAVFSCATSPCGAFEQGQTCGSDGVPTAAQDCFPRGTERFANYIYSNTALVYVDATACPMGYSSVGSEVDGDKTTRIGCCPPNFRSTSVADGALYCTSYIDFLAETVVALSCQPSDTGVPFTITTEDSDRPSPVWMRQIQVVLKDGVTWPEETATSSPTSSTQSSGALGSPTASSPAAPSNPGTVGKSGLSTGAIAGIAVGAVALFALMAIGAFILFRRRKRNSQTIHKPSAPSDVHYSSIPELAAPAGAVKYRYDGGAPSGTEMRMAHPNEVMELPGNNEPVELPGHKP